MAFISKRLLWMLLTMLATSFVLFLLLEISPGSVATKVLGPYSSEEQRMLWMTENGYDRPFLERYFSWLGNVVRGDFGHSTRFNVPVNDILWDRLASTALLGGIVLAIVSPLSILLGSLAGMNEGSITDRSVSFISIITTSMPEFATAVFMLSIFVFWLGWLPGTSSMTGGLSIKELIMPVLVLVLYDTGYVIRIMRQSMIDVMSKPFVRTAILKGLPRYRIFLHHTLRNAIIAPFTVIILQINWLLSGVIVVEFFFAYKGFGSLLLEASLNQDIYLIEACALVGVVVAVCSQTLADICYSLIDPRIRTMGNTST